MWVHEKVSCGASLALADSASKDPTAYWRKLKQRLLKEGSEVVTNCHDLKMKASNGKLSSDNITEETINQYLATSFMPEPELLIRTGGEKRLSNFLLWQSAYSEFYFTDTYWPDFSSEDFYKAICDYQSRQRRFGKTEEQVENESNKSK